MLMPEWNCSCSRERLAQPREHHEVSVKPDALNAACPRRRQPPDGIQSASAGVGRRARCSRRGVRNETGLQRGQDRIICSQAAWASLTGPDACTVTVVPQAEATSAAERPSFVPLRKSQTERKLRIPRGTDEWRSLYPSPLPSSASSGS